jgi:hypothetical protein
MYVSRGAEEAPMNTDTLIAGLTADVSKVSGSAARLELLKALGTGGSIACALVLLMPWLGARPDLVFAASTGLFWVKLLYTIAITAAGFVMLERTSRPDSRPLAGARWVTAPFGLLGCGVALSWLLSNRASGTQFWFGSSWWQCPLWILSLSLPVTAALTSALSRLAPARPLVAGICVGVVAGAAGATAYALHCAETSPGFVLLWYSAGLAASALVGGLLGARLLRW